MQSPPQKSRRMPKKICSSQKDSTQIRYVIEELEISESQKRIFEIRFLSLLKYYEKRKARYSCSFHTLRVTITVGSLIVPALLSLQQTDSVLNVYWLVWTLSLFVTISNGILTLLKIDKKYYTLHSTFQNILSEGWQYIELSGRYSTCTNGDQPNHANQFAFFCHKIEKIRMKQVEEEYYKIHDTGSSPNTSTLQSIVPLTPFNPMYGRRKSQLEINGNINSPSILKGGPSNEEGNQTFTPIFGETRNREPPSTFSENKDSTISIESQNQEESPTRDFKRTASERRFVDYIAATSPVETLTLREIK